MSDRHELRRAITALVESGMNDQPLAAVLEQVDALYQELEEFRGLFDESAAPGATAIERAHTYRAAIQLYANTGTPPTWGTIGSCR